MSRSSSTLQTSVGLQIKVVNDGRGNQRVDDGSGGQVAGPVLVGIAGGEESHRVPLGTDNKGNLRVVVAEFGSGLLDGLELLVDAVGILTFRDTVSEEQDAERLSTSVLLKGLDVSSHHVLKILDNLNSALLESHTRDESVVLTVDGGDGDGDRRRKSTTLGGRVAGVGTDHHCGSLELVRNLVGESTELGVNLHGDVTTVLLDTAVGLDLQRLETLSNDRLEKLLGSTSLDSLVD